MKRASSNNKQLVVDILSESFVENKSVLFVVGNDKDKIPKLMEYSFDKGLQDGEVWINDNNTAALIALYPFRSKVSFRGMILDLKLLISVIGITRLFKILQREKAIKARQPKTDFIHLWYIGVLNSNQNSGEGTNLLNEFVKIKAKERFWS